MIYFINRIMAPLYFFLQMHKHKMTFTHNHNCVYRANILEKRTKEKSFQFQFQFSVSLSTIHYLEYIIWVSRKFCNIFKT